MITVKVTGAQAVVAELKAMPPSIQKVIGQSVGRMILKLTRLVKKNKLHGQVLHVRSGRLTRSIHPELEITDTLVEGTVGTDVEYARVHEYGFTGSEAVKAHLRKLKGNTRQRMKKFNAMGLRGVTTVEAHSRNMHLPERSFLRSALQEMEPEIVSTIQRVVNREIGGHA